MAYDSEPQITSVDRLTDCLVVGFSNGMSGVYPANLLLALLPEVQQEQQSSDEDEEESGARIDQAS
jgi:hypothetical protein